MAKQITGNYFYMDKNGGIVRDSHPGKDKKSGYPKPPSGVKDVKCWTELKQSDDLWFYPDGSTKSGGKSNEDIIPFEENDSLVVQLNKGLLHSLWLRGEPEPFWRYAIEAEWKATWIEEWENRASAGGMEWWKAEIKAFLSVVKDLSSKNIELGDITKETMAVIKERYSKKKEVS